MFTDNRVWFCILTIFVSLFCISTSKQNWRMFKYTGPVTFHYYMYYMIPNAIRIRCLATCKRFYNRDLVYFQGNDCYCLAPVYENASLVSGTVTTNREFWTTVHDVTSCSEKGYTLFPDQRYCLKKIPTKATGYNAEPACRQDGGHLVSVYTQQDLDNLKSVFVGTFYVGAYRKVDDPVWNGADFVWITGGTVTGSFWKPGDPTNGGGTCVVMFGTGKCINIHCDYSANYICQLLTL